MEKETMNRREFLEKLSMASVAFLMGCTEPAPKELPKSDMTPTPTPDDKVVAQIKPDDYLMTNQEAERYAVEKIHPRLESLLHDPRTPDGIKNRLTQLFTRIKHGEILYYTLPAFHPASKNLVAKMDYDPEQDRAMLVVFVPVLQERLAKLQMEGLSDDDQTLDIGIIFSHEYIHHEQEIRNPLNKELAGKKNDPRFAELEAEAWGLTMTELVRPAVANGHQVSKEFALTSEFYTKIGENWHDPRWMRTFDPNRQQN